MKDDQRTALTKRLLQEGLLRLLKTKDISKVNVTELCNESGINRATFYRHYEHPRDILSELRRNLFQETAAFSPQETSKDDLLPRLENMCSYFYEHKDVLEILFRSRTDDEFVQQINELYQSHFRVMRETRYGKDLDDSSLKLATYYYAAGIYYILRQWLSEPINKTPREVAHLIARVMSADQMG